VNTPAPSASVAPLWVALTHHGQQMLGSVGAEAMLLDDATADTVRGRTVILAPSAAKPGLEVHAARRLRGMGAATVATVTPDLLHKSGASDTADLIETAQANGTKPKLDLLAALAVGRARASERPATKDTESEAGGPSVQLLCGADVRPEPINWLWRDFLARGKLHIIAGAPGAGKTTIAMAFAATVTAGGRWPDRTRAEPGNVLIWSGEDDFKDTLLPRLIASGADRNRVYFVGNVLADGKARPFDPARDMPALEREAAQRGDVRLLIVDPIVNAVAGDSHKNTETRRAMQPIVDLASRLDAAAIGISHFSKGTAGRDPVERVCGSVAFGALPRVIFAAAKATEENSPARRLFVRSKSNIGPDGGGFGYDLEQAELPGFPGVIASRVLWGGPLEGTARDLLATVEATEEPGERTATDEAMDWLREELRAGPVKASDVQRSAKQAGISDKALRLARGRLGIKPRKSAFAGGWEWALPNVEDAPSPPRCPTKEKGNFESKGHLQELGPAPDDRGGGTEGVEI